MELSPHWKNRRVFCRTKQIFLTLMWESATNVDLHLDWSKLRPAHLVTLLNHPVKCRVHSHSRVRAVTCNTHTHVRLNSHLFATFPGAKTLTLTVGFSKRRQFKAAEDASETSVSTKWMTMRMRAKIRRHNRGSDWKRYQGRRFPIARCRKTRRHSRTCTHSRRCSLETSTWPADEPAGDTNASISFTVLSSFTVGAWASPHISLL